MGTQSIAVSVKTAAVMLGVSRRTVQSHIRVGTLPARKIGRRTVIRVCDLELFLNNDQPSPAANQRGELAHAST